MLKHKIKHLNDEGQRVENTYYFNLTRIEVLELDAEYDDDLKGKLQRIGSGEETSKQILAFFKDLIGRSYGERTAGGKFVKNEEFTQAFTSTDAYSELLLNMFQNGDYAAKFIEGLMPADVVAAVKAEREKETPTLKQQFVERANERAQQGALDIPVDSEPQQFRPSVDHMERPAMPTRRELREGEASADPNIGG